MGDFFLSNLNINQKAVLTGYDIALKQNLKRRLLELGFYIGVELKIVGVSFLKNVLLIELNGYLVSLRKNIASNIFVCEVKKWKT